MGDKIHKRVIMWNTEKRFLEWLLKTIKETTTLADLMNKLCALKCVDFDKRTTSIGSFIAISTAINGNPYVYSFLFENENDINEDDFQLEQLRCDMFYYLCTEDDHVWNGEEFSKDYVPRLFNTYDEANRVRQRLYKSYDTKILILEWY